MSMRRNTHHAGIAAQGSPHPPQACCLPSRDPAPLGYRRRWLAVILGWWAACCWPQEPGHMSAMMAMHQMDRRMPVPLSARMALHQKAAMRAHLEAVQAIIAALPKKDFAAVARAAASMGYSKTTAQMCRSMGAGAQGFTERAIRFHRSASAMETAAHSNDTQAVLERLAETLGQCTTCHATYRQQIIADPAYQRLLDRLKASP